MTDYSELAKVAHVADDHTFVINRGTNAGVELGANFLIFRLGERISDPATGEDLGTLEMVIGRARTIHVQDKIATLESTMTKTVPGKIRRVTRQGGSFFGSFGGPQHEEIEEGKKIHKVHIDTQVGDYARPI